MKVRLQVTREPVLMEEAKREPAWLAELADRSGIILPFEVRQIAHDVTDCTEANLFFTPSEATDTLGFARINLDDPADLQFYDASSLRAEGLELDLDPAKAAKTWFLYLRSVTGRFEPRLTVIQPGGEQQPMDLPWEEHQSQVMAAAKPIALVIHGFQSFTEGRFTALKNELLKSGQYGAVVGCSYPTNRQSIKESGTALYERLKGAGLLKASRPIDIYAHSQGGLVSRSMLQSHPEVVPFIRNLTMAGTPQVGTPMANAGDFTWEGIIKVIGVALGAAKKGLWPVVTPLVTWVAARIAKNCGDPGLEDMFPAPELSAFLQELNAGAQLPHGGVYIAATHLPDEAHQSLLREVKDAALQLLFREPHDGVVPERSAITLPDGMSPTRIPMPLGDHGCYYGEPEPAKAIVDAVLQPAKA